MSRRNLLLITPLVIMLLLVGSTFFVTNPTVKKFLFLSIPMFVIIVVMVYIFISWQDFEQLRDEVAQLRKEREVYKAMMDRSFQLLEADVSEIRKKVFSDRAASLPLLEEESFDEGLVALLTEIRHRPPWAS